jgi:hypothetical protein
MTFKKKMLDSKTFITSNTERGIVIREEIRRGTFSVSNSALKKNFDHGGLTEIEMVTHHGFIS